MSCFKHVQTATDQNTWWQSKESMRSEFQYLSSIFHLIIFHLSFIYFPRRNPAMWSPSGQPFFRGENGVSSQATRGGSVACNVESYCWGISMWPSKLTKIDRLNHGMHGMFMDVLISCIIMYDSVCCTSMMFTIEHRLWHDAAADKYVYAVLHGRQAVSFLCPQVKVLWQELQLITAPGSFIVIEVFNMSTQICLENTQKNQKRYMVSYLALRKSVIHLWIWGYFGAPHFLRSQIIWCTSFCLLDKGSTFWLSRARFCPAWEWRGRVTDNDGRSKRIIYIYICIYIIIYICILWPKSWNIGGN